MFTTGSKFFYGVASALFAIAVGYGYTTGGRGIGPLIMGYKWPVGEQLGYTVLIFASACAVVLGLAVSAFRDADPVALAEVAGTEMPPAVAPASPSYWPPLAAFAGGVMMLGLVISNVLFVAGSIVLGVAAIEWLVQSWAERATGDPETNRQIRNRIMYPFEIPLVGAIVVVGVVASISRVLLATSEDGAVAVAGIVMVLIIAGGALIAARPQVSRDAIAIVLVIAAIAVLAAGIIGASVGERDFHHEEEGLTIIEGATS